MRNKGFVIFGAIGAISKTFCICFFFEILEAIRNRPYYMDFRVYSNLFIYLLLDNTHFNRKVELNILCIKNGRLARASN